MIYAIRLTMPKDLRDTTGVVDIRRSLQTTKLDVARRRCLDAERWFRLLVKALRNSANPTRHDIERAAALYFARLQSEIDVPREFPDEHFDAAITFNVEETRKRIAELNEQLATNTFGPHAETGATAIANEVGATLATLDHQLSMLARQLATKAAREQMRYLEHQLLHPGRPFELEDQVFASSPQTIAVARGSAKGVGAPLETLPPPSMALSQLVKDHIEAMVDQRQGLSHVSEFKRVTRWLLEEFGENRPIATISVDDARGFRDKIRRIDAKRRSNVKDGEKSLAESLTDDRSRQLKSETARRYWSYVRALFRRAVSEGYLQLDPAASLEIAIRRDEETRSPEPYSTEELKAFFAMPLFAGSKSKARRKEPGSYRVRDAYWWSGMLQAWSGMRGGELSQLLPSDFVFDSAVPHILIRREDETGAPTKQLKSKAARRAIPIADELLTLGIREFVEARAKRYPGRRIFAEFALGTGGKVSDGLSKFWRRYLPKFGLHKPGRATHVWRHTVVYHLRSKGVSEEDIGYLVGHATGSQTSRYGDGELLARVQEKSLARLDYGFDVVEAVGGPFSSKLHAE